MAGLAGDRIPCLLDPDGFGRNQGEPLVGGPNPEISWR